MKFTHICVIGNFKQISPASSSEYFDFVIPDPIEF